MYAYNDKNFEKAMEFLFPTEGGYSNRKNDWGGPTNLGITQITFNSWRKMNNLPLEDVRNITKNEAIDIYYNMYWKRSGADRLEDPRDALMLFDTAVQYGDVEARNMYQQSGEDFHTMLDIRRQKYRDTVIKYPEQGENLKGWLDRVYKLKRFADKMLNDGYYTPPYAKEKTPFDADCEGLLNNFKTHPK